MPPSPPERLRLALLVGIVSVRTWIAALSDKVGIDGAYYLDVSAHVRDGNGLVTDVSLFHAGMPTFPHPTPIYPLWPLLLGYTARLLPLKVAAVWLPHLLSLLTLVLAERLARAVRPEPLWRGVDAGHLTLLAFGLNTQVLIHATRPYTENLAFLLLVCMLWRLRAFLGAPTVFRALELGAWLGALVLCRSQMVLVSCAVVALLVARAAAGPDRWRPARAGLVMVVGAAAVIAPWAAWLATFTEVTPATLLSFQTWQATPLLPKVDVLKVAPDVTALLVDRGRGFLVALDPLGRLGYFPNFAGLTYAPLIALPLAWRARRELVPALRDSSRAFVLFLLILGAGWALSLQLLHKENFASWNFSTRHAVPSLPLFLVCGAWLLAAGGRWRRAGLVLWAITSLYLGNKTALSLGGFTATQARTRMALEAGAWVRAHTLPGVPMVAAADDPWPQYLARSNDGIGWHWVHEKTDAVALAALFDELGVQFLLVPEGRAQGPGHRTPKAFAAAFLERTDGPKGWRVYERRRGVAPAHIAEEASITSEAEGTADEEAR